VTLAEPTVVQSAQIVAAYEIQHGAALAVGVSGAGATYLELEDLDDFADAGGEIYLQSLEDAELTTEPLAYAGLDRATNRVLLSVAWSADLPLFLAGDSVWISPAATERRADVALDGEEDQIVVARIPYALAANIPLGVRGDHAGEWVRVRVTEYGYALDDAILEYPRTDPESISITDPDTGEEIGSIGGDAAFDTVTADEIISPSVPRRNYLPQLVYVDPVQGSDDNDGTGLYPLVDTFERTNASAWGTSDSGNPWTILQNDGLIDCGVLTAGAARIRWNGSGLFGILRTNFSPLDVEISTTVFLSVLPSAGTSNVGVIARASDKDNWLFAGANISAAGNVLPYITKRVGGTVTNLAQGTNIGAIVAGTDLRIRAQIQTNADGGTDVRVKVWLASGTEPDDWQTTYNETGAVLQQAGYVGAVASSGGSVGNQISSQYRDLRADVIDGDGNVVPVEATGVGPFATISAALELAGEWNDADVRLVLTGVFDESIFVNGLAGGGRLFITGGGTTTLYGIVRIYGATQYVELRDMTIQDTADAGVSGTVEVRTSRHVEVISVKFQTNSARSYNVFFTEGSDGRVQDSQLSGATAYCVQVAEESTATLQNNSGSAPNGSYRAANAIIWQDGTKPSGATATSNGGQIFGAITTSGGGTPPPTSTKVTKTFTPNGSRTWRPEWAWREDDRYVYQGEYAGSGGISRGCVFHGTKLNVGGKTADSGKIFVKRRSSGGQSAAQAVFLFSHDLASQPSGDAAPGIKDSGYKLGELAWGAGKWFDIPKAWVQSMLDGAGGRRGFGLYHASASPYVIAVAYNGGGDSWKVKFTYH
jgi:acylphosphatase